MAKNKNKKPAQQGEVKKSNVADAAFKKKVTIINGCILLAFIIGLCVFLGYTVSRADSYKDRLEAEIIAAKEAALVKDSDKSVIDIEVTDEMYVDWMLAIDESYHKHDHAGEEHENTGLVEKECFDGNTIHFQGVFEIVKVGESSEEYWVYRKYIDVEGGENKIPIEVQFKGEVPENGAWVDVVGTVSSNYGLSCIKEATVTVLDESEKREFVK